MGYSGRNSGGPEYRFGTVSEDVTVGEGGSFEPVINVLEFFLSCKAQSCDISMKSTKRKHSDRKLKSKLPKQKKLTNSAKMKIAMLIGYFLAVVLKLCKPVFPSSMSIYLVALNSRQRLATQSAKQFRIVRARQKTNQ